MVGRFGCAVATWKCLLCSARWKKNSKWNWATKSSKSGAGSREAGSRFLVHVGSRIRASVFIINECQAIFLYSLQLLSTILLKGVTYHIDVFENWLNIFFVCGQRKRDFTFAGYNNEQPTTLASLGNIHKLFLQIRFPNPDTQMVVNAALLDCSLGSTLWTRKTGNKGIKVNEKIWRRQKVQGTERQGHSVGA